MNIKRKVPTWIFCVSDSSGLAMVREIIPGERLRSLIWGLAWTTEGNLGCILTAWVGLGEQY